jgi:hypothetical protein
MTTAKTFCCAMRAKYLLGLVGVFQDCPVPAEFPDFVLDWGCKAEGKPMVFAIKFCPFCGTLQDNKQSRRVAFQTEG